MLQHWLKVNWRRWQTVGMLVLLMPLLSPVRPALAWQRQSNSGDPVQLWIEDNPRHAYRTVRADIIVVAPIFHVLRLLQDPTTQHEWLPHTHKVEVLEQPAPTQTLVHFETEARWPFSARDAVTLFSVSQPDLHQILIKMDNQPDAAPRHSHLERIETAEGYWLLTALPGCQTQVRYESGSVWGGNIPQWLVNRLNVQISRTALMNLREWAPRQPRQKSIPAFLQPVAEHELCP